MSKPALVVLTLASTALYLAVAIAMRGGLAAFLDHPPLLVVAGATIVTAIVALFTRAGVSSGVQEDRGNRWVLPVLGALGLASAVLPAWSDRIDLWTIDGETTRWAGVLLYLAGSILRMWPVFVLGSRFSGLVAIQPEHTLVTTGIYARIRHPSYLGLLVIGLGWALAFRSGIGLLLVAATLPPLIGRMNAEERLLRSHFGAEYEAYRKRTTRLVPGLY